VGGFGIAWPGPGVAGEGIGVGSGELPDAVQEVADHQELVVGVLSEEVAGAADEVAEDFLVPVGGGLIAESAWVLAAAGALMIAPKPASGAAAAPQPLPQGTGSRTSVSPPQ
jgi:hypothetical protein